MKKLIVLVAGLVLAQAMVMAQTAKDPQQELNQVQQKIRSMQATDQQVKAQVSTLKKDQAKLEADVKSSNSAGDSLMKATMDSVRISNERNLSTEKETVSLRSSLSLQQNLVIVALVLVVCLFLLFLWQRRMVRALASVHESDLKKVTEKMDLQAGEVSAKISALQDQLAAASVKTEEKIASLKTSLSGDLAGLKEALKQTAGQIKEEHRADMETEQKRREEGLAGLNLRIAALDEKLETGLNASITRLKQETEHHQKEMADLRKTLQEVSKSQKGRGTSAE